MYGPALIRWMALIYAQVGELDKALDRIEMLLSTPSAVSIYDFRIDPNWEPVRDHPRFQALLKKYG